VPIGRKLAMLTLRLSFTYMIWSYNFQPIPEDLVSSAAHVKLTREPVSTYVRMEEMKY
jgi:hypothetical protein